MAYLITLLTFCLFILVPIDIGWSFNKKSNDEYMNIKIGILRFIKFYFEIPTMFFKIEDLEPLFAFEHLWGSNKVNLRSKEKTILIMGYRLKLFMYIVRELYKNAVRFKKLVKVLTKRIVIKHFDVRINFGINNPALTGIVAGQIWTLTYFLVGLLTIIFDFSKADINVDVNPVFDKREPLKISSESIFRLRAGHIIIVGVIALYYWIKLRRRNKNKGSDNLWTGIQLKV